MADERDSNVVPIRKRPDFSDPVLELTIVHLDGTVTREVYDRRRGLIFVGWRTDRQPEPPRRWMPWSRWFFRKRTLTEAPHV